MNRHQAIETFLRHSNWHAASVDWLPGDASFRRYARLYNRTKDATKDETKTALLMDSPPEYEDISPYIRVADCLRSLGLSAPAILDVDETQGLAIIEDFGHDTYTHLLAAGHDPTPLYTLAVDCLIDLHQQALTATDIPPYSDDDFAAEHVLLIDWYTPAVGLSLSQSARDDYLALWSGLLPQTRLWGEVLVLRDFHVDNLIHLNNRPDVRACGLLDFQDARMGPRPYDLVSLLQDARRDVDTSLAQAMIKQYCAAFPDLDEVGFMEAATILAAQRHCKVLGIFTRLAKRDGKTSYLEHIPRLWHLLIQCLEHPILSDMRLWFDSTIPAPSRQKPIL